MSTHKTPYDTWEVRYREEGRNRSRTFKTEEEADAFDRNLKTSEPTRAAVQGHRNLLIDVMRAAAFSTPEQLQHRARAVEEVGLPYMDSDPALRTAVAEAFKLIAAEKGLSA